MYHYTDMDKRFVQQRALEFRGQVERRLSGALVEDEFRPLRLMNGLYLQRHAYMLRVAIPYGLVSSAQVRKFALIAERYDRGYGHITTRQNIQFNWMKLEDVPDILDHLASVEMHAIQTSGNCVRNISCDPYAGVAADELLDPRPYCELLRQYSSLHPEFMFLPRKFKLAFTGAAEDRAAVQLHDIGVKAVERDGVIGWRIYVGGGLGRTPRVGKVINEFLPLQHLISYVEAILRVYNLHGRRDNKYKARIKILVGDLGVDEMRRQVLAEWELLAVSERSLDMGRIAEIKAMFDHTAYDADAVTFEGVVAQRAAEPGFDAWMDHNVKPHKVPGYHIAMISLKAPDRPPGDATTAQLEAIADLADRYNSGHAVATYTQNMLFQDVRAQDLYPLYQGLMAHGLATPNIGTIQDMICCPGLDFCSLANSSSIPVARALNEKFHDLKKVYELGPVEIKMSGCINACGHHHIGHIGILGVDKRGEEFFQIALGGTAGTVDGDPARVAEKLGQAVALSEVPATIGKIMDCYTTHRRDGEAFLDTVGRIGIGPFKEHVYE